MHTSTSELFAIGFILLAGLAVMTFCMYLIGKACEPDPENPKWWYSGSDLEDLDFTESAVPAHMNMSVDKNGYYYFWDETQSQCYGPFLSLHLCAMSQKTYGESIAEDEATMGAHNHPDQ